MFSANENIVLRQHKRRVIEYVESTIPENALDLGTAVMAMQVSCRQPGCVPLETAITIVFPKPITKRKKKKRPTPGAPKEVNGQDQTALEETPPSFPQPLLPDLEESRIGGSFKTRILKPLSDVTEEDVLDALPPSFAGGRRTTESLCLKARDTTFAQIGQLMGNDESTDGREGRRLVADYLKVCLEEYVERGCVAPEWGQPFSSSTPFLEDEEKNDGIMSQIERMNVKIDATDDGMAKDNKSMKDKWGKGNFVMRRPIEESEDGE